MKLSLVIISLLSMSLSTLAQAQSVPKKVMDAFQQRHPNALDVSTTVDKHFNQELIKVAYKVDKEEKEKHIEVYRPNGHFFINAIRIQAVKDSTLMPAIAHENLKAAFPSYEVNSATLIPNPNGAGEEFDLTITSAESRWHIVIDRKGAMTTKEKLQ